MANCSTSHSTYLRKLGPMTKMLEERDSSRREFLNTCLQGIAGFAIIGIILPLAAGCGNSGSVLSPIDSNYHGTFDVSALTGDGSALVTSSVGVDGYPIIIMRQSSMNYVAFSSRCTHSSCQVDAPLSAVIVCTCHGSEFDLSGNVRRG